MEPADATLDAARAIGLVGSIGVGDPPLTLRALARSRRLWLAGLAGVMAAGAMLAGLFWQGEAAARRELEANAWATHALEVLIEGDQFQAALRDLKRGSLGFVQTGDATLLAVERDGAEGAQRHLVRLRAMTADNRAQARRLEALTADTDALLALDRQAIALQAQGNPAASRRLIEGPAWTQAATRASQVASDVVGEERRLFAERQTASRRADAQAALFTRLLAMVGALALVLAGALGGWALIASARAGMASLRADANERLAATGALLSLFIADAPAAIAMFDRQMRYLAVSQRYVADYGLAGAASVVGRAYDEVLPDVSERWPGRWPERWRDVHARVLRGETMSCDEDAFARADGRLDWVRWRMEPWRDAKGAIGGALLFSEVITAQVEALRAHRAADARLRAIVDTAADAIVVIDEQGLIQSANPATTAMFGYAVEELLGRNVAMLMPQPHRSAHDGYLEAYRRTGVRRIPREGREVEALRKDGSRLAVDLAIAEWRDGETRFFTGLLRDVTSRKMVETQRQLAERRDLVVRELRHRINNMFAVVNSLVLATARSQSNVVDYRDALLARITAFSAAQIELARQGWSSRPLRDVVEFELRPYLDGGRVSVDGPDLLLNASASENLSMIVHELATNAAKYGALSVAEGRLAVRWDAGPDANDTARLRFEWSEAAGPAVSKPERTGFGTTLIEAGARSLGAVFQSTYASTGFRCSIDAPAARNLVDDQSPAADG